NTRVGAEWKWIDIHQRSQFMCVIADIASLENHARGQLLLDVEIVLVDVRRAEMRINQEDAAGAAKRLVGAKVGSRGRRSGREPVGSAGIVGAKRIRQIPR